MTLVSDSMIVDNINMASIVRLSLILVLIHVPRVHLQVYIFQTLDNHEERLAAIENTIANMTTMTSCCKNLRTENELLKIQNQQLQLMMQNLTLQISQLQSRGMTTITTATNSQTTTQSTTQPLPIGHDCADLASKGEIDSGLFTIEIPSTGLRKQVYCDFDHDGGRWTVIQRRQSGVENFTRGWDDYRDGFGNASTEFWLGNEAISQLTAAGNTILNIKLMDWDGVIKYAQYDGFHVGNEATGYKLTVGKYTGSAGDSFNYPYSALLRHNGMAFSTPDRDNDKYFQSCARILQSGWWFNSCYSSNLNGKFIVGGPYGTRTIGQSSGDPTLQGTGIEWYPWKLKQYSMPRVEMKIRPV